jgi:hypothetical protein
MTGITRCRGRLGFRSPLSELAIADLYRITRAESGTPTICQIRIMKKTPAVRALKTNMLLRRGGATRPERGVLLDHRIPLGDRFEVAARILCPGPETTRTVH